MFVLVFITGLAGRKLTLRENLLLSVVLTMLSMAIFVALFGIAIPLWPWSY
jgi:Tripartite tricarboxylate transporter TctB family.